MVYVFKLRWFGQVDLQRGVDGLSEKTFNSNYLKVKIGGTDTKILKGRLVKGPYKPICGDCAKNVSSKSTMIADCVSVAYWFDTLVKHLQHSVEFFWGNFFGFNTLDTFHVAIQLMMQHGSTCPPPCANTNRDTKFPPFPKVMAVDWGSPNSSCDYWYKFFLLKPPVKFVRSHEHLKGDKLLRGFIFRKSLLDFGGIGQLINFCWRVAHVGGGS